MSGEGITCHARCPGCGEFSFDVRYRAKFEDLIHWMETVVRPGMGEAHRKHNAVCISQAADLKLPINEAAPGIGQKPVTH